MSDANKDDDGCYDYDDDDDAARRDGIADCCRSTRKKS